METQPTERIYSCQFGRTQLRLEREIGAGGEGQVYSVSGPRPLAAKLYHHPDKQHMIKLSMMLMNPPLVPKDEQSTVVWPVDGIMDEEDQYVGFLMPLIDKRQNTTLAQIYHPESRRKTAPTFSWKSLLSIAANIAALLDTLHTANYVVGDLNESNILVNIQTGKVQLIDCDSIQVPAPDKKKFRCLVGKPEYTPPELQKVAFDRVDRLPEHDNFALAVLIFLLLMEGVHPFTGARPVADTVPLPADNIRRKQWPYASDTTLQPPRYALPLNVLPSKLQELMQRCFLDGNKDPHQRPTAREWCNALEDAQTQITRCIQNKQHWYSEHLHDCPWCKRQEQLHFDSFTPSMSRPVHKKSGRQAMHPTTNRATYKAHKTRTMPKRRIAYFIVSVVAVISMAAGINSYLPKDATNPPILNPVPTIAPFPTFPDITPPAIVIPTIVIPPIIVPTISARPYKIQGTKSK